MSVLKDDTWEYEFEDAVLQRGYDYYLVDAVLDVVKTDDGYAAVVEGSSDYNVSAVIQNGEFIDADCDCPYAGKGNFCKHEAALLYYLSSDEAADDIVTAGESETLDSIDKIVGRMTEKELRALVSEIAGTDSDLRERLFIEYSSSIPSQLCSDLRSDAAAIIRSFSLSLYDPMREDASDVISGLSYLAEEKLVPLVGKKDSLRLFSLAADIIDMIPFRDAYDCGFDDVDSAAASLEDVMGMVYESASEAERAAIEDEARDRMEKSEASSAYRSFLIFSVRDKSLAKRRLDEIRASKHCEWGYDAEEEIRIMKVLGAGEDDIISMLKERESSRSMRLLLVSQLLSYGKWKDCIQTILDFQKRYGFDRELSQRLKEIYRSQGLDRELKAFILDEIAAIPQYSLDNILELRRLVSDEEWACICSMLRKADTVRPVMAAFLDYIGDDEALMAWIEDEGYPDSDIIKYEEKLLPLFPMRVIAIYEKAADQQARRMHDRSGYAAYALWLRRMKRTPEGMALAIRKARDIRLEMPRRTALHDELLKAGL